MIIRLMHKHLNKNKKYKTSIILLKIINFSKRSNLIGKFVFNRNRMHYYLKEINKYLFSYRIRIENRKIRKML
jgi:hypothetical protein